MMTFDEICAIEPRVRDLHRKAQAVQASDDTFCANEVWFQQLKPALCRLVGWGAQVAELSSATTYEVAYHEIYQTLPECRRCGCL